MLSYTTELYTQRLNVNKKKANFFKKVGTAENTPRPENFVPPAPQPPK